LSPVQRYRIKTVSEMTGIPRNTLLAWERRHGILAPERLSNGYRLYSDDDVTLLRQLKAAVSSGIAISQALHTIRAGASAGPPRSERVGSGADLGAARDALFGAFSQFDRASADAVVASLGHVSYASLVDDVYVAVLRRVGEEWAEGRLTIAQEHFASAFVREQLVVILVRLGSQASRGPRVACVTFPGERHELALLALTVHLALRGCRVTYLGSDVPLADLVDFLGRVAPDCLCVGAIIEVDVDELARFARAIRRAAPPTTRVIIGGAGLPGRPKPVKGVELLSDWHEIELG